MRTGASISGGLHAALLIAAIFGTDWFSSGSAEPLLITEIEMVDGTEFDAALSTAPVVPNEGPSELSEPAEEVAAPQEVDQPEDAATETEIAELQPTEPPEPRPDRPEINIPPPPTNIPTEAPRPSDALVPIIDELDNQAQEAESPPSTEPVQPLASRAPVPGPKPTPPPEPEPEPEQEEKPEPVEAQTAEAEAEKPKEPEPEPDQRPDPETEIAQTPEAPEGPAPQQAKLPLAKPAELAAAARAASAQEQQQVAAAAKPQENAKPKRGNSGGSTAVKGPKLNRGEKNALRLGIKKHYVYGGDRSDRSLRVTIRVKLNQDGTIDGKPVQRRAKGGTAASQRAVFQAGRRALIKAANAGEFRRLPANKYNRWKVIDVVFTATNIGGVS
ncbi:MAG: hypothetical protein AAFV19_12105 [Pseudomonadota bacterium]